jgi:dTDP-4-amino-4,6-dideoxygalactose transaminase
VWHVFAIRSPKRDALSAYLNEKGIATQIYYPTPNHLLNFYRGLGYKEGDLPSTEKIAREILALPLFPEMTEAQIKHVAQAVRAFEGKKDRKTVKI